MNSATAAAFISGLKKSALVNLSCIDLSALLRLASLAKTYHAKL